MKVLALDEEKTMPIRSLSQALQQTRVECTWDEAPSERQVLLGRVSQWRDAAEEDFEVRGLGFGALAGSHFGP